MSGKGDLYLRTLKLLSQRVVNIEKFFSLTACMNLEEREIIGLIYAYDELTKDPKVKDPFNDFLMNKVVPALQKIGRSKWGRTELTDLGFMLGDKDTKTSTVKEELRNILNEVET